MKRVKGVAASYRSLIVAIEKRRRELRWPMYVVDEKSGIADSLFSKMVAVDAPSGRQAEYSTLDDVLDALFPSGWRIQIVPDVPVLRSQDDMKAELASHSQYSTASCRYERVARDVSAAA